MEYFSYMLFGNFYSFFLIGFFLITVDRFIWFRLSWYLIEMIVCDRYPVYRIEVYDIVPCSVIVFSSSDLRCIDFLLILWSSGTVFPSGRAFALEICAKAAFVLEGSRCLLWVEFIYLCFCGKLFTSYKSKKMPF